MNTRGGYFSHFEIVGANPFRGFRTFKNNNNNLPSRNNNNNNLSLSSLPLPLPGFGKSLGGGFNPPLGGNARRLDSNVAALVNTLTGANLRINHIEREFNHVKPMEFRGNKSRRPYRIICEGLLSYYLIIFKVNAHRFLPL